ncbi:MAG TPA: hypothetical protein VKA01_01365 [Vicinamibacteria bacterium]|nr:hypothetical protein [Vicinamibacteria bacterium]
MRLPLLVAGLSVVIAGCGLIDSVSGPKSLTIQKFEADPDDVSSGGSVTLTWDVEGAEAVALNNGIGVVPARGSHKFSAYHTSTFTLTARSGTSSATASVQVSVRGTGNDPLNPLPTPSPDPSPSPTPTPSPSPTPDPSPTPTPSPDPPPGPAGACGVTPPSTTKGCEIDWEKPAELPEGQCIDVNTVTVDQACPATSGTSLSVGFAVTAKTALESLRWRLQKDQGDTVTPDEGTIDVNGKTSVLVSDTVGFDWIVFEVVDQDNKVRLRFRLMHK